MAMKKFINKQDDLVKGLLECLELVFPGKIKLGANNLVINKNIDKSDRVKIVTLGGAPSATCRLRRAGLLLPV